jgi:ubiquitin C-terminal hydrolase
MEIEETKLIYNLSGVVHHYGDIGGGHYTNHSYNEAKK